MKTFVSSYYTKFRCKAGACRHNCCIGWEIDVDEETLAYYRRVPGELGKRLKENLVTGEDCTCFRLGEGERCPFLNGENLCDLITCLGEEHLCDICAAHPRFRNYINGRREMGLGLCCEEAAALILSEKEPVRWVLWEEDGEEEESTPWEKELFQKREAVLFLVQDRQIPWRERLEKLTLDPWYGMRIEDWREFYLSLDRLEEERDRCLACLTAENANKSMGREDIYSEQLLTYFVNRHLPDACDPWDLRVRLAFCILSCRVIETIAAGMPELPMAEIARLYSAEVEYSEENTALICERIEELLAQAENLGCFSEKL